MAYIPTEWKIGDVITADKLNKIEQGIANKVFIVTVSGTWDGEDTTNIVFDLASASSAEIKTAFDNGVLPMMWLELTNTTTSEKENVSLLFVGYEILIGELDETHYAWFHTAKYGGLWLGVMEDKSVLLDL